MTNIKEVIHLYLGCEVRAAEGSMTYTLSGIDRKGNALFYDEHGNEMWLPQGWKIAVRRLDSMTEAEAIKLCSLYSTEAFGDYRFSKWVAVKDEANFCYNVTNKNSDMSFSVDLEKMHIKVYEGGNDTYPGMENHTYFTEYLKMGFDVFGLIPSGQAIDKNLKP